MDLIFFSRASAATNFETKKMLFFNDDSCNRLKELTIRYRKDAPNPLLMSIDAEGLSNASKKTPLNTLMRSR
jgi:hypothetical protein